MPNVRVRKDVWKLADWDDTLLWYAKAILRMQERPVENPTSWLYQAAIHDFTGPDHAFWKECQHSSWFFLPWHRMYLLFFEQIVAAAIVELGGPADWALPYWNYSDGSNLNAQILPPAFRDDFLPGTTIKNPLKIEERAEGVNDGEVVGFPEDVDLTDCMDETQFAAGMMGIPPGFGGPKTLAHHQGGPIGSLERTPHGSMHVAVGGDFGFMSSFDTAGLDPIFWLHHANIDRLWTVWLKKNPAQNTNPKDTQWLTGVPFSFNDATATPVTMTSSQVVDSTAAPLFYRYEDESDPFGGPVPMAAESGAVMESGAIPEMTGATEEPITLRGTPQSTTIAVNLPTGPAAESGSLKAKPFYLNIENITGFETGMSYAVYLNLPAGSSPAEHPELNAGVLPMFGLKEASQKDDRNAGDGLKYTLNVGKIVRTLRGRHDWDPQNLRITFVPMPRKKRESGRPTSPIQIGQVRLFSA